MRSAKQQKKNPTNKKKVKYCKHYLLVMGVGLFCPYIFF